MTKLEDTTSGGPLALRSSAGFGLSVGQEVTVTRRLWEPADECHPGGMLAQPGDRLIVRAIRDRGEWPISVSHHDRTDGMTFSVAENELQRHEPLLLLRQAAGRDVLDGTGGRRMRCPECGAATREQGLPQPSDDGLLVVRNRICNNDHDFTTYEVMETVWKSAARRHAEAAEAVTRRLALAARNAEIRRDAAAGMRGKALANKWGLTPQAISLILSAKFDQK